MGARLSRLLLIVISLFLLELSNLGNAQAKTFSTMLCQLPEYTCYIAKRGDSWQSLFKAASEFIMSINRINTHIHPGMKIAIPKKVNLDEVSSIDKMDFAPLPIKIEAPGQRFIYVSLKSTILAWGAYDEDGNLLNWGPISGGQDWCSDIGRPCHTKTGTFTIYEKEGPGCVSTKFPVGRGGAPMPYCMYFNGGFALHGSYEVPGYNASHGCVRMFIDDAKWLNREFLGSEVRVPVVITNK